MLQISLRSLLLAIFLFGSFLGLYYNMVPWKIKTITSVSKCPSSVIISSGEEDFFVGFSDGSINKYDESLQLQKIYDNKDMDSDYPTVIEIKILEENKTIIAFFGDGQTRAWDLRTGKNIPTNLKFRDLFFSPDENFEIKVLPGSNLVLLKNRISGKNIFLEKHSGNIRSASFSNDGKKIITTSDDATARIWEVETGMEKMILKGHRGPIVNGIFSAKKNFVLTESLDGTIKIWNVSSGTEMATLKNDNSRIVATFSPHGRYVLATSSAKQNKKIFLIKLWEKQRPEAWWGIFFLWEFWIFFVFLFAFIFNVTFTKKNQKKNVAPFYGNV